MRFISFILDMSVFSFTLNLFLLHVFQSPVVSACTFELRSSLRVTFLSMRIFLALKSSLSECLKLIELLQLSCFFLVSVSVVMLFHLLPSFYI